MRDALKEHFGHDDFLPGQEEVINAIMEGRDTFFRMATSHGKSLCFQLPATLEDAPTLVISPLIALMRDQVRSLLENKIPAASLNSNMAPAHQAAVLRALEERRLRLIYVAPEQLGRAQFQDAILQNPIARVAVDEAHCVSMWGHDFRPAYQSIAPMITDWEVPQIIGCTATASVKVARDIEDTLGMEDPYEYLGDLTRPNLDYSVLQCGSDRDKMRELLRLIKEEGPNAKGVLVYCSTRHATIQIYQFLRRMGFNVGYYHGGMQAKNRKEAEEDFMNNKTSIMVSTNAFGMGVDKPDIRLLVHFHVPGNIESYIQESGRAGRDKKDSKCVVLYNAKDWSIQLDFLEQNNPSTLEVQQVYDLVDAERTKMKLGIGDFFHLHLDTIAAKLRSGGKRETSVSACLAILNKIGAIALRGQHVCLLSGVSRQKVATLTQEKREWDTSQLVKVRTYAEADSPDQKLLLGLL